MEISKQELLREALETGFRPEIMEKVWHLMALLDAINDHSFLQNKLVLKGGTALNLFIFDVPRLSVDIDLNYIGAIERAAMMVDLNFMFRVPFCEIQKMRSVTLREPFKIVKDTSLLEKCPGMCR